MKSSPLFALVSGLALVSLLPLACSSASSGEGGAGSGSTGKGAAQGTGTSRFTCCIDDVAYRCPDEDAFDRCSGGIADIGACHAACGADPICNAKCDMTMPDPDPSDCQADETLSCTVEGCNGVGIGDCDIDADCDPGEHCTQGKCFDNQAGSACNIDADCGNDNHCTGGCCYTSSSGTPCNIDADCGSGECVSGTCSGGKSSTTSSSGPGAGSTSSGETCPAFCEYHFDCCIGEHCNDLGFCEPD